SNRLAGIETEAQRIAPPRNSIFTSLSAGRCVVCVRCGTTGNGDRAVHANEHSGFCRQIYFFALPCQDINRTAGEANTESTNFMAEDYANQRAAACADRARD